MFSFESFLDNMNWNFVEKAFLLKYRDNILFDFFYSTVICNRERLFPGKSYKSLLAYIVQQIMINIRKFQIEVLSFFLGRRLGTPAFACDGRTNFSEDTITWNFKTVFEL